MSELRVRFSAADSSVLQRILEEPLLFEEGTEVRDAAYREVYFDTAEAELERHGIWVSVRLDEDGAAALRVARDAETPHAAAVPLRKPLQPAPMTHAQALFADESAEARRLRAQVEPARLLPWLEVSVQRQVARTGPDTPGVELACDRITAREAEVSTELHEVEVSLAAGTKGRRKLLRALEARYGLVPVREPLPLRARRALGEEAVDWLEEAVRASRRVAVVALADGCVSLIRDGRGLRIPTAEGTGEEAARRILRAHWESAAVRLRLLGAGAGSPQRPATEVWLAEPAGGPLPPRGGVDLVPVPAAELLTMVGAPALRDEATLAALNVLARSDLPLTRQDAAPASPPLAEPVPEPPPAAAPEELPAGALLNMELSTLAFNRRVLALAADAATPLVERVRFIAIFSANLDEFFRVRVAGFKRQMVEGSLKRTLDGATAEAQLDAIGVRARHLQDRAYQLLHHDLLPELGRHGLRVLRAADLSAEESRWADEYYEREVHAVLTPLAAGPGHPFPHIRNLRPAVTAILREPHTETERLAVVELPDGLPRFVPLPNRPRFLPLEELICSRLHRLYPGAAVDPASLFRVTRSAELHLHERGEEDVLHAVQEELAQRRFRPVVRLEVEDGMSPRLREALLRELRYEVAGHASALSDADVYPVPHPIDLRAVRELAVLEGDGLTWPETDPAQPIPADRPVLDAMRERDWLLSFPQDSFEATVERFVLEAADDPEVRAIKLALYRTNRRSRILEALRRASARGKQVVALVELTARFDEERNIEWAQYLRRHGIHVVYGVPGVKVHAKIALVVRREGEGLRRYAYVGTGNLNAQTARAYTDLGLLTADPALTEDVAEVFNLLTGAGGTPRIRHLLVAPLNMREEFVRRIRREADHARAGRGGHIRAKFNGLADREVVAALYEASRAGVRVELIVRSLCVLRPGVRGLSENIRVISILGRHLEHSRIFRFANDGAPEYFIGSADWRTRNLSRRVEVAVPIHDPEHRARLDAMLQSQWEAPEAWELGADGTYYPRPETPPRDPS